MLAPGLGLGEGELVKEAGDSLRSDRPVLERADARALRSPWADEGRFGGLVELLGEPKPSGGADGEKSRPANAASS